jgi:hypothetical protein
MVSRPRVLLSRSVTLVFLSTGSHNADGSTRQKAPLSGSRLLFASTQSYWDKYTMHSETDGELTFDVAVVRRYSRPSRSGTKRLPPTTLVYAVVGKRLRCQVWQTFVLLGGRNLSTTLWH